MVKKEGGPTNFRNFANFCSILLLVSFCAQASVQNDPLWEVGLRCIRQRPGIGKLQRNPLHSLADSDYTRFRKSLLVRDVPIVVK